MKKFIKHFKETLEGYIEPYLKVEVYTDDRLQPGYHFNEEIAQALCRSVCMIVIYSPRYEEQEYCLREYRAMEDIEKKRRELLGDVLDKKHGFIIPVIFRARETGPPDDIKKGIHYCDFSKYSTANPDISKNKKYCKQIEKIARYIFEMYERLEQAKVDPCSICDSYKLPEQVKPFEKKVKKLGFPHR